MFFHLEKHTLEIRPAHYWKCIYTMRSGFVRNSIHLNLLLSHSIHKAPYFKPLALYISQWLAFSQPVTLVHLTVSLNAHGKCVWPWQWSRVVGLLSTWAYTRTAIFPTAHWNKSLNLSRVVTTLSACKYTIMLMGTKETISTLLDIQPTMFMPKRTLYDNMNAHIKFQGNLASCYWDILLLTKVLNRRIDL